MNVCFDFFAELSEGILLVEQKQALWMFGQPSAGKERGNGAGRVVSAESMGAVEKCADWDNCSFVGALIEGHVREGLGGKEAGDDRKSMVKSTPSVRSIPRTRYRATRPCPFRAPSGKAQGCWLGIDCAITSASRWLP